jgi:predicted AlkP superfamily pyrophosphatase or phosphodiesterase
MKKILPLFIMVDACGWEIIKNDPFAEGFAPHRKRLDSVFGYSSTCVPSILSGRWPEEHRHWCYFVYNPQQSPFKWLRMLRAIPQGITGRRVFRRWLSKVVKWKLGYRGYFDLYNIPFKHIALYDFTEKTSPLRPQGMNRGQNIFDFLELRRIPYFVSDPDRSERENLEGLIAAVEREEIDFGFVYWPGLDGLLHQVGNDSPQIPARLRLYEEWIGRVLEVAGEHYDEVHLYVFSDHGMANCDEHLDLRSRIEALDLKMGKDYAVVYDSTMARFWFFNDGAREAISACLERVGEGRILLEPELRRMRAFFSDEYFGQLIFLVREGVLIVPSHMGERPIRAMHGYHPEEKHSYAALLSNRPEIPAEIAAIPDIFKLMTEESVLAWKTNGSAASTAEAGVAPQFQGV